MNYVSQSHKRSGACKVGPKLAVVEERPGDSCLVGQCTAAILRLRPLTSVCTRRSCSAP